MHLNLPTAALSGSTLGVVVILLVRDAPGIVKYKSQAYLHVVVEAKMTNMQSMFGRMHQHGKLYNVECVWGMHLFCKCQICFA